jgi:hypothetical protein
LECHSHWGGGNRLTNQNPPLAISVPCPHWPLTRHSGTEVVTSVRLQPRQSRHCFLPYCDVGLKRKPIFCYFREKLKIRENEQVFTKFRFGKVYAKI